MDRLTDTQQKVYTFICHYISEHGKSPLLPEIAKGIGIKSIGSLHKHIQALVEHKFIDIIPHRHRGIRLIERPELAAVHEKHKAIADKAIAALNETNSPDLAKIVKSLETVQSHLKQLLHKGISSIQPAAASTTKPLSSDFSLPLLGKIAAGKPIEAIPHQQELDLTRLFTGKRLYALQVQGDSMIEEGILDGDKVICEQRDTATDGEIVVALIDQENATLKRFKRNKNGTITLIPANQAMSAMTYTADRVQIQGVLLGVVRLRK